MSENTLTKETGRASAPGSMDLAKLVNSEKTMAQFARALPRHLSAERFARIVTTALTRTPKLNECGATQGGQASFLKCLIDLSAVGLEPDGRRAHLIPFENRRAGIVECQLIIDYKGIVELVRRDPSVVDVQCYTIRANDTARVVNGRIEHAYDPKAQRGEVVAVYTRIDWASGHTSFGEPFTREEAEAVKKRSRSGNDGPWVTDFVEMWKKSAIRRDSKMWPLSPEIRDAVEVDDDQFDLSAARQTPVKTAVVTEVSDVGPAAETPGFLQG